MKKAGILLIISLLCTMPLRAQETETSDEVGPPRPLDEWTFFQIGFLPNIPGYTKSSNVYGLKLGLPMCSGDGRVYGFEASWAYSGTSYINGCQGCWWGVSICHETKGVQAAGAVCVAKKVTGIQASIVNVSEDFMGFQAGAVNVAKPFTGFQMGAVNVISEELTGVQFGVINYSKKHGCQFGFINIIEGGWLPFTLLFNVSY